MMRFICVVALFAVIASAAGGYTTCGVSGNKDYSNTTGCDAVKTCASTYCTCVGGTASAAGVCSKLDATCDKASSCSEAFLECMEAKARTVPVSGDACSAPLSTLRIGLNSLSSGVGMWNTSSVHTSCKYAVCLLYNETSTGTCTTLNSYEAVCSGSPVTFSGIITLSGNWSKIFSNATALAEAKACLVSDLTNHLRYPVSIISVTADASGGAKVEYTVDAAKGAVEAELTSANNSTAWLKCLTAAKFAELGGTGTLKPTFSDTPTPTPGGTPPSPPTPPPTPPPAGASMMWSAVQVLAAVVAVLVIA
jgi:hypothetical protein